MRVVIEADGGSRGNPGPAAYGSILRDAETGAVIAERAESIGIATNNVAEYRGLIGGLELLAEHAPGAEVEVRMDSKLVIEQMAGRWKVKHPSMRPLALEANRLVPRGVTWTWVPRESNKAADAILNVVLDELQGKPTRKKSPETLTDAVPEIDESGEKEENPLLGWREQLHGEPTTLILLRHGVTGNTVRKLFCGAGGTDPGLNDEGREQAVRAASYLSRNAAVDAIISSPLRRTRETAEVVGEHLGLEVGIEEGIVEAAFGEWDGLSFADVMRTSPRELETWLSSTAYAPPGGGEDFDSVYARVQHVQRSIVQQFEGKTVVAASHVTPIKMLVRLALGAPMSSIYRMELAPASITTIQWWPDGTPSLRGFSLTPTM